MSATIQLDSQELPGHLETGCRRLDLPIKNPKICRLASHKPRPGLAWIPVRPEALLEVPSDL